MSSEEDYLKRFEEQVLPQIEISRIVIGIMTKKPDAKLCLEIGAAILLDKPIVLFAEPDVPVPQKLRNIATAIVVGRLNDPETKVQFERVIKNIVEKPNA